MMGSAVLCLKPCSRVSSYDNGCGFVAFFNSQVFLCSVACVYIRAYISSTHRFVHHETALARNLVLIYCIICILAQ